MRNTHCSLYLYNSPLPFLFNRQKLFSKKCFSQPLLLLSQKSSSKSWRLPNSTHAIYESRKTLLRVTTILLLYYYFVRVLPGTADAWWTFRQKKKTLLKKAVCFIFLTQKKTAKCNAVFSPLQSVQVPFFFFINQRYCKHVLSAACT